MPSPRGPVPLQRKMITCDEVGQLFGLTGAWVRKRLRAGDFPIKPRTIGGVTLFSIYDVENYFQGGDGTDGEADAS